MLSKRRVKLPGLGHSSFLRTIWDSVRKLRKLNVHIFRRGMHIIHRKLTLYKYIPYSTLLPHHALRFFTITGKTCGKICMGRLKKGQRRTYLMNLMRCFCSFFILIFYIKHMLWVLSRCNSNGYPQLMPL